MVSLNPPVCDFGWKAPDFNLPDFDGHVWNLESARGKKATLIMFICNHCPYVKAIRPRLVADIKELRAYGVNAIAIQSNDVLAFPEDNLEKMKEVSSEFGFTFPYVIDETQSVARAYGAVCTPDFFGFNGNMELQYRGRFDDSRKEASLNQTRDLFNAMKHIAETGQGPQSQIASIGCSIKWKE